MELRNLRGRMVCLSTLKSPQDIELPHYHHIFFNTLGKRRRNANESSTIYQLTLTSRITRLLREYRVREQKWQLCPVPNEPGEALCLSCPGFAHQHSSKPQTDPKSACFTQTPPNSPVRCGSTTDPSTASLSAAPGGDLAPLTAGSATKMRSGMAPQGACNYREKQTEAFKQAACLQTTYFVPEVKHQGVGIAPGMSPCPLAGQIFRIAATPTNVGAL